MFSLEAEIQPYTKDDFSAEIEAQHFFRSYGEADISKKLVEMSTIQQSIETVLRQKVRANYGMFLLANEEINLVDEEISDLKHLISNTQKLIDVSQFPEFADCKTVLVIFISLLRLRLSLIGCTKHPHNGIASNA